MSSRVYVSLPEGHKLPGALLEEAAFAVLDAEGVSDAELSVTILEDEFIRELNVRWRGHDWIPDVLSFALHASGESPVGDIYVGLDQASRQAREQDIPVGEELVRLVIHGALHVLGYDHPEGKDRDEAELYRRQEALVRSVLPTTTGGALPGQACKG
jgi:probable rRNA maturation factor